MYVSQKNRSFQTSQQIGIETENKNQRKHKQNPRKANLLIPPFHLHVSHPHASCSQISLLQPQRKGGSMTQRPRVHPPTPTSAPLPRPPSITSRPALDSSRTNPALPILTTRFYWPRAPRDAHTQAHRPRYRASSPAALSRSSLELERQGAVRGETSPRAGGCGAGRGMGGR
jgi:hypothetical protein